MKKTIILIMAILAVAALTACGSTESETPVVEVVEDFSTTEQEPGEEIVSEPESVDTEEEVVESSVSLNTDYENAVPVGTQLGVGTIALQETDHPVDVSQANTLIFYWSALLNMTTDETVAAEEIAAIYSQIEEAMTPDQLQAIADMQLTMQDMGELMGMNGGMGGRNMGDVEITDEMREQMEEMRASGEMPEGMAPGTGGGPGGGAGDGMAGGMGRMSEEGSARFENQAMAGLNPVLIQAVIDHLNTLID